MASAKLNPDEVDIDEPLVRRLVASQFPQWRDLPIAEVHSAGTDRPDRRAVDVPRRTARRSAGKHSVTEILADYPRSAGAV